MTNREAMEIVLVAAEKSAFNDFYNPEREKIKEAIWQMQDYKNDLMREEPSTGCDYGIGG